MWLTPAAKPDTSDILQFCCCQHRFWSSPRQRRTSSGTPKTSRGLFTRFMWSPRGHWPVSNSVRESNTRNAFEIFLVICRKPLMQVSRTRCLWALSSWFHISGENTPAFKLYEKVERQTTSLFKMLSYYFVITVAILILTPLVTVFIQCLHEGPTKTSYKWVLPFKFRWAWEHLKKAKLALIPSCSSVPYSDLSQSPHFEIWYGIIIVGGALGSFNYFVWQLIFVSVCMYTMACLKDVKTALYCLGNKWVPTELGIASGFRFFFLQRAS